MQKLKFYFMGLVPGMFIVFFILNKKDTSCSYFPNDRVISESLSKDFIFSEDFNEKLKILDLSKNFIRDSIIKYGRIDFRRSEAQKKPCQKYTLTYPKQKPKYEVEYQKCKENVTLSQIKKLD